VHLYGPAGFLDQVERKLHAYTWNLVENYENDFSLIVTEVHPGGRETRRYRCQLAFKPEILEKSSEFDGTLVEDRSFRVKGVFLDHRIPCLAFRFEETWRINVMKNALAEMGLPTGKWLMAFKEQIMRHAADDTPIRIWWNDESGNIQEQWMPLGSLRERVIRITPGKRIVYVTDVIFHQENAERIIELADGADLLFIEATFLHADADRAKEKYHLTAMQAGSLARQAHAKRMILFHFSPKYRGSEDALLDEASAAFYGDQ
jgi:ribonuclease Z